MKPGRLLPTFLTICFVLFAGIFSPVYAQNDTDYECPEGCSDYRVDFACQRAKLVDPKVDCEVCVCAGDINIRIKTLDIPINIFNVAIRLDSDKAVGQLIFLVMSMFLGVVALATAGLGIFAAVKRAQAETDDDVAQAQKTMTNALVGFVLVVISILIAQLVASYLGVGSLDTISRLDEDLLGFNLFINQLANAT